MDTVIIEGRLGTISSGTVHTDASLHYVHYMEVGGIRYDHVIWSDYMDNFIQEARGKNVRLSVGKSGKRHIVAAIEYDGKIEKERRTKFVGGYTYRGVFALALATAVAFQAFVAPALGKMPVEGWFVFWAVFACCWTIPSIFLRAFKLKNALHNNPTAPGGLSSEGRSRVLGLPDKVVSWTFCISGALAYFGTVNVVYQGVLLFKYWMVLWAVLIGAYYFLKKAKMKNRAEKVA